MRHSATRPIAWIYLHVPLVGAIVLAAVAAGDMPKVESEYHPGEELTEKPSLKNLYFFFVGGRFVALVSFIINYGFLVSPRSVRATWNTLLCPNTSEFSHRFIAIIILCLGFAEIDVTLLMGMCAMLYTLLLVYETVASFPGYNVLSLRLPLATRP